MLQIAFNNCMNVIKNDFDDQDLSILMIALDGWSEFQHLYSGISLHFVYHARQIFLNMVCCPMDEINTGKIC